MTLQCEAYGHPVPDLSWFKDNSTVMLSVSQGVVLPSMTSDTSTISTLTLFNVSDEDAGMYSCRANNSLVEDRMSFGPTGKLSILCKFTSFYLMCCFSLLLLSTSYNNFVICRCLAV